MIQGAEMAKKKKPSWDELKSEYATTEQSYRTLAEKYKLSFSTLTKMAKKHKWTEARQKYREELVTKTVEKTANDKSDKLALIAQAADKMGETIARVMDDKDQFFRRIDEELHVEYSSKKADSKAIKEMTSAIKELTSIFRNIYNIHTEAEDVSLQLARERLEIEKRNAALTEDMEYGVSAGVVLIPPVDEDEDEE